MPAGSKVKAALCQHEGAEPLVARVPGRRQRRIPARHLARIRRLRLGRRRRAGEDDLSRRRYARQMEGVAIIKGGPNPESAKAFVDYINRKDVREMILKATFRRPARQDLDLSNLPGGMPPSRASSCSPTTRRRGPRQAQDTLDKIKDIMQEIALSSGSGRDRHDRHRPRQPVLRIGEGRRSGRTHRPRRRVLHPPRALGLRQDHAAAHDRGLLPARRRRDPLRRAAYRARCPPTSATSAWCSRTTPCSPT